ncbi:hypothetical protein LV779_08365 [Streptomyces thinghirensis]|nr:hypothetical protein [Streptomyces thinghirensis]
MPPPPAISALRDAAMRCAELSARCLPADAPDRGSERPNRAGLLYGATGSALLFLRLYERTGDTGLLDLAGDALRQDLARCVRGAGGALQVDEGWRTMPYPRRGQRGHRHGAGRLPGAPRRRADSSGHGRRSCARRRPCSTPSRGSAPRRGRHGAVPRPYDGHRPGTGPEAVRRQIDARPGTPCPTAVISPSPASR